MASFWNALTRNSPRKHPPSDNAPADSGDIAPTTSFTTASTFDPSSASTVSSFLTPLTNDPSALHPLANLGGDLTYLDIDDAAVSSLPGAQSVLPSRGWSDDLCYGTGTTYLVALTMGGAYGMAEGLKKLPHNTPPRLALNGVLNAVTRRGPFVGNSAGVLAIVYNGFNSTIGALRGKHDVANSILSGALAGAVFKSTRGIRPMAWSSALVATAAGVWTVGRKALL
ncbi:Tim17/Tim22/Tim23/Pmp24 family-domain-containing protein [Trichophaea hybrida]|nr:Tim17/Tim22/Tim23/Pmp24 family-domain-containing protein [Trichophaea hybrida]